jgi:predicted amidohydrolase
MSRVSSPRHCDSPGSLSLRIHPQSLDLLCFPEMAFSGYVFENSAAITPYLEHPRTGPTSQFCADIAKKLQCYVLAGFPEKLSLDEDRKTDQVGANSAVFYGPDGEWVGGYRKTHLYETDLTWAKPGGYSVLINLLFFPTTLPRHRVRYLQSTTTLANHNSRHMHGPQSSNPRLVPRTRSL